jgi:hypothetical protein
VVIAKGEGPLGLSIVGGSDHACHPFGLNEPGLFISKVISNIMPVNLSFSISSCFDRDRELGVF